MRKFSYLLSAAAVGSVLAVAAITNYASAQSAGILEPQGGWSVTRVNTDAQSEAYCTLVRAYQGNIMMSVAQNQLEEFSLAIDFQKPQFDADKAYSVNLQPGPGQLRAYELMPASQSAMVIRLGWDNSFFKALDSSKSLKVEIDDVEYVFNVPEINVGKSDLENCTKSIKSGSEAQADAQIPRPPEFAAEKTAVRTNVDAASQEPKQGQDIVPDVAPPVALKPARIVKAIPDEPPQDALKPTTSNIVSSDEAIALRAENEKLNRALSAERKKLEEKLAQSLDTSALSEARAKVALLEKEKQNLAQELQSVRTEKAQTLATQKTSQEGAITSLQNRIQALEAENIKLQTQQKTLEAQAGKVATLEEVQTQLASMHNENQTLKVSLQNLQQEKAAQQTQKSELESQLQQQVANLQKERDDLRTSLMDTQRSQDTVKSEERQRIEKERTELLAVNRELVDKLNTLQGILKGRDEKIAALEAAADAQSIVENNAADTSTEMANLQSTLNQVRSENDRLKAELQASKDANLQTSSNDTQKDAEIQSLQANIQQLQTQKISLEEQLRSAKLEASRAPAGGQNANVRDVQLKLDAAIADNKRMADELEKLRTMQEDSRLGLVAGDWSLEAATKRFNEAEREIRRLGLLLEQERSTCTRQKAELEGLLFDPAVAEKEQIKRVMTLETELKEARAQLQQKDSMLKQASLSGAVSAQQAAAPVQQVGARQQMMKDAEIQDLRRRLSLQENQIQAYQNQTLAQRTTSASDMYRRSTGEDLNAITPAAGRNVPRPPVSAQPKRAVQQASLAPQQRPAPPARPGFNLTSFLNTKGIASSGAIQRVSGSEMQWSEGALKARAVVVQNSNFQQSVQNYIQTRKQSCNGDFASIPSQENIISLGTGAAYEIACIGQGQESASSVVFTAEGNNFIAISYEADTNTMDQAMDVRDQTINRLAGNS